MVSRPEDLFAFNTYYRGALTLQALRLEVGDRKFERIVRTYYRTYRNGNATSADFIRVAAEIGGAGVRRLLRAWLYEQPVPPLPGASSAAGADPGAQDRPAGASGSGDRCPAPACAIAQRRGDQLSRNARRKLSRIGWTRYSNMVRSPVMIMASAGMPALRRTSGVFFCTAAMST